MYVSHEMVQRYRALNEKLVRRSGSAGFVSLETVSPAPKSEPRFGTWLYL